MFLMFYSVPLNYLSYCSSFTWKICLLQFCNNSILHFCPLFQSIKNNPLQIFWFSFIPQIMEDGRSRYLRSTHICSIIFKQFTFKIPPFTFNKVGTKYYNRSCISLSERMYFPKICHVPAI